MLQDQMRNKKNANNMPEERVYVVQYIDSFPLFDAMGPIDDDMTKYDDDGYCSTITLNTRQFILNTRDTEPKVYDIHQVANIRQSPTIPTRFYIVIANSFGYLTAQTVDCHLYKDLVQFSQITFNRAHENMQKVNDKEN
jgi:hypothetical protein